jgi:WD40 repeat protein
MTTPGTVVTTIAHDGYVHALAFSPDAEAVVTGDDGGVVKVWPVDGADPLFETELGEFVPGVGFSPDGTLVAAVGRTGLVVHDANSGVRRWRLGSGPVDQFYVVGGFSRDGTTFAVARTTSVVIADALTGAVVRELVLDQDVTALAWGGATETQPGMDAGWLAVGTRATPGSGGTARAFDAATGAELWRVPQGDGEVTAIAWSPDRSAVLSGGVDQTVHLLDAESGREIWALDLGWSRVTGVAFDPTGRWVVASPDMGGTRVLYATVGVERHRQLEPGRVASVVSAGRWAASAASNEMEGGGTVTVFAVTSGAERYAYASPDQVNAITLSPGGRYLAVAAGPNVQILDNGTTT